MAARVKLHDVVEAMDLPNQDWQSYLNRDTGEIVTVTDEDRSLVEDGEELDDLPDWQREAVPKIREALESDRFLPLPDSFEIHEWSIMERFGHGRESARQRDELIDSLHGRGAFRMFKSAIRRSESKKSGTVFVIRRLIRLPKTGSSRTTLSTSNRPARSAVGSRTTQAPLRQAHRRLLSMLRFRHGLRDRCHHARADGTGRAGEPRGSLRVVH